MNEIKQYETLTYIETFDGEVRTVNHKLQVVENLLKSDDKFLNIWWTELIAKSNIKRVFTKELSDVDKVIYSIEDKTIREQVKKDVEKRLKDWLRVNVEIVSNLLCKYQ